MEGRTSAELMAIAYSNKGPEGVAAGLKAVDITNNVDLLTGWARSFVLPEAVKTAAGLKAIDECVKKGEWDALKQLSYPFVIDEVRTAALSALKKHADSLANGGMFSNGTVPAPAGGTRKETGRHTTHTG